MDEITDEEDIEDTKDIIKNLIDEIENNNYRLDNYSNDIIIIVINYFIKKEKLYLIDNLLKYLSENSYNINNFELYQETLIRSLTIFIMKANIDDILDNIIFKKYINLIQWSETLYYLFMKLLLLIDNIVVFRYILNIAYDLYDFDINRLFDFIINPLNTDLHINNTVVFNLTFTSLDIFKLLLDLTVNKIDIINKFYNYKFMNLYYKSEIYLDQYNTHIYKSLDLDKCNYYIYRYYDNLDSIKDNIIKYLIIHSADNYEECIDKYNLDPTDYIVCSVRYNNKIFFNKYIDRINKNKYLDILRDLSSFNNYSNLNIKLIKKIKLKEIDKEELRIIFNNALKYNYLLAIKIYKHEKYNIDLNKIFNKNYKYGLNNLINLIKIDYNDEKYMNLYLENIRLLNGLLRRKLLNNNFINKIFIKILDNNSKKFSHIIQMMIKNITLVFDYEICFKLYEKKYYNALNIYLNKYYYYHRISFDNIKLYYSNIIRYYNFKDILIKLNITKQDADYIIDKTHKYNKNHIDYLIKNVKKII